MTFKKFLLAISALFVVLAVVPFLIPASAYVPRIEQAATDKLGVPVHIESMRFAVLPSPRIHLKGLSIGPQNDVQVSAISAVLDVTTLFDETRVISRLNLDEPLIRQSAIPILSSLAQQQPQQASGPASVELRRIVAEDAKLELTELALPSINADVALGAGHQLEKAILTSSDNHLEITATPDEKGYAIGLKAKSWTLPVGAPLVFDTLEAKLLYENKVLKFPKFDAALYRGQLHASGQLDMRQGWHLAGKFTTQGIEVGEVSRVFTQASKVTGRISGNGTFRSVAEEPSRLAESLRLEYKFKVQDGVLHGVDLVKAASLLIRQGATGGETRFDALEGTLMTRGKQIEVKPLHIVSGLLSADGKVKIGADKSLSGQIDADIKKGVSLVTVPLVLSGTVDQPSVMPTKAAFAGGAAGTVLMGPLGTGLGVKAGSALDKLFGGEN